MHSCAVITRTRSRPLLLQRAMSSVAGQRYRDFQWILVNDAGEAGPVDDIAAQAEAKGISVTVLHRQSSQGMEAASNAGVRASRTEFVAIHDDDDSWAADFLDRTTRYLRDNQDFIGVCSHANRITERISDGRIKRLRVQPHEPVLESVQLADMLRANLFPPIAFLYRRHIFDRLNGYDESMSVLGDWDFNIRALLVGDIGVIPEAIANYHVRSPAGLANEAYRNSLTQGSSRQAVVDASYRNRLLRRDLAEGKAGIGTLLALARQPRRRSAFQIALARLRQLI